MSLIARRMLACSALALVAIALPPMSRDVRAARVLLDLMRPTHTSTRTSEADDAVVTEALALTVAGTRVRARLYLPRGAREGELPALVLLHGAHPRGIDEARLISFARSLSRAGLAVLTPELPELMAYRIDARTTERIATLARVQAARSHVHAVGVMGISFAGGLALIAAANAHDAEAIAFVVAVGAHHDLMRLTEYYAGMPVKGPHGEPAAVRPHPYGARVMLREHLDRFFASSDLERARHALDTYLHDEHARARREAEALSAAGRERMRVLLDEQGSDALSQMLLSAASEAREPLAEASPRGQLAALNVPVFLVHGADDPIIPSLESLWLEAELPPRVPREVVVSPLLRHAEIGEKPTVGDSWTLVRFMAHVLAAAGAERWPAASRAGTDHAR